MTEVTPVVEIPVFDRITKLPAVPRFTVAGLAASEGIGTIRPSAQDTAISTETLLNIFICL
jgi:hypothetical protein